MAIIEFRRLSLSEAEEVMTELWNCLEENDIPSPQLSFAFGEPDAVTMSCRFREPFWARLVAARLANWLAANEPHIGNLIGGHQAIGGPLTLSGGRTGRRAAPHSAVAAFRQVPFARA